MGENTGLFSLVPEEGAEIGTRSPQSGVEHAIANRAADGKVLGQVQAWPV